MVNEVGRTSIDLMQDMTSWPSDASYSFVPFVLLRGLRVFIAVVPSCRRAVVPSCRRYAGNPMKGWPVIEPAMPWAKCAEGPEY